jgi:hypothetical protein
MLIGLSFLQVVKLNYFNLLKLIIKINSASSPLISGEFNQTICEQINITSMISETVIKI